MPQMANITVKDSNNADVTYNAATASAGDSSPARWTANAKSPIIGQRPSFTLTTRDNNRKNGRHITGSFKYPVVQEVNGVPTVIATLPLSFDGVLPTNVDAALAADGFTQFGGLVASALVREVAADGYAPT